MQKPNFFLDFLYKVLVYLDYKRQDYLFYKSKKYITHWGTKTYGVPRVLCFDKKSTLSIGSYCSIASDVSILLGANHKRGLITTFPIDRIDGAKTKGEANERGDVQIGNDVWIGYGATIIGNAIIGDGAIIGAHALVLGDVPPYAVVGGVPAKVLKYRFEQSAIEKLLAIQWWNWNTKQISEAQNDLYSPGIEAFIKKYT